MTAVRAGCPVIPMKITYKKPRGLRALWRRKPFLELVIKTPLYADRTLPQKQAVEDLMQRTIRVMGGTEERGLDFNHGYIPEPAEAPVAETAL